MVQRPVLSLQLLLPVTFVVLWSTGFIGAKFGLPYVEPLTFNVVRFILVVLLMTPIALLTRAPWPATPRAAMHIAVTGLLVHGGYLGGVFTAIDRGLPAGPTALVVGLQPLLTALLAGLLLGEQVTRRQWLGLGLGLGGVLLVLGSKLELDGVTLEVLLHWVWPALFALCSITLGTLYQKRFCPAFDLRSGSVIQFLPCVLVLGAVALVTETREIQWNGEFVFALLWLVLVLSIGAITLLNKMISQGSAVKVASLFYLTPPTTALIAWLLFGEMLAPLAVVGMLLSATGVWLARR
ncbi:EamA/RhaT family transporter [Stutzerimonas nosocomialis]|uniref:DMT family transporter n=1 Tax=Stutzerimonas nosocomialis TaxID=1056496 RepID=UPI001108F05B|nr:DMT family transporter [Stutzerimonas nosocomialis]TLX59659.1 EamA/RhaT family transporter [Stutzerimonas nosocomialis]